MSTPRRLSLALAAIACTGLAASGCSLASDSLPRPDAAAVVGGQALSVSSVEADAETVCDALDETGSQPLPRSTVDTLTMQYEVYRSIGEQLAADYDVEPSGYYEGARASAEQEFAAIDDVDLVVDVLTAPNYLLDVAVTASGGSLADPLTDEAAAAIVDAGLALARDWVDENGLRVNPRFPDVEIPGVETFGQPSTTFDDGLSVPVSEEALDAASAAAGEDPAAEAASLPDAERCGA